VGLQHADLVAFMLKNTPKIAHFGSTSKVFILRMPPSGRYPTLNFLQRNKKEKKLGLQQANFVNFVSMLKNTPKIASLGSTSQRGAYLGNAPLWRRNSTGNFVECSKKREKSGSTTSWSLQFVNVELGAKGKVEEKM